MQTENSPVFISIQTSAYSGATLLAFLLGAHPQIATVGEMNGLIAREDPDLYLCSCGQKIKDCAFWKAVEMVMWDKGFKFDVTHFDIQFSLAGSQFVHILRTGSFRNTVLDSLKDTILQAWPRERRQLKMLVARNVAFVEAILEVTGKRVFVDTSKDRLRLNALRKFSTLDVRAVHLVRDVRGVVASRLRRRVGIDVREAAQQWVKLHRRLQTTLASLPEGKWTQVRYEDLCRDVPGTLERLYRFCGADPELSNVDFRAVTHHIVGNPMRLASLAEIRPDERWQSLLTSHHLSEIERVAGPLSRQYGYSWVAA